MHKITVALSTSELLNLASFPLIVRPEKGIVQRLLAVAEAATVDAIVCVTERVALLESLRAQAAAIRLIAVTRSQRVQRKFRDRQFDPLLIPPDLVSGCQEQEFALAAALRSGQLSAGDMVACALDRDSDDGGLQIGLQQVPSLETLSAVVQDVAKLVEGVQPQAFEAALQTAARVARGQRRGRRSGTFITLGDVTNVLTGSVQLIPNPVLGHPPKLRTLLNRQVREMLIEFSKLDGATVVDDVGLVETVGAYLAPGELSVSVLPGLGTRHVTAASVTARTRALAVVVSATDGTIRIFSRGKLAAEVDPDRLVLPLR